MNNSLKYRQSSAAARGRARRAVPTAGLALAATGALVATMTLPAAAATSPSPAGTSHRTINLASVTINIGDQAGAGSESLLKAAGLLDKLPFKAKWADFTSGPPMLQAEAAGSIDIGEVGDAPPVFALSGGAKLELAEAIAADPTGTGLLVPKGSAITKVSQLRGKTIAVAQGSSSDYHLLVTLQKSGLSVKDVTLDYLQPAEALAALTSGKVAAWDVWSPYVEEAEADGARSIADGTTTGTTYSFEVASSAALANPQKAAAIKAYLTDVNKAYAWEKNHTSAWATTWGAATGLSLSIMQRATKDDVLSPSPITAGVVKSEQGVANAFYAAGLIPNRVNIGPVAYTGFNSLFTSTK